MIISSATLDAEAFYRFFNHNTSKDKTKDTATIISLEGRMYPVDTLYTEEPLADYVEGAIQTVFDIHTKVRTDINSVKAKKTLTYQTTRNLMATFSSF